MAPNGTFLYVNQAWRNALGYTDEEVRRLRVFDVTAPECHDHCINLFQEIMAGRSAQGVEVVFRAKNGRRLLLEGNINCRQSDGRPVATRAIFRDVTEQRRMEEEIGRAQRLESLGVLAGGIAHDFNNLLTAILNNLSIARLHSPSGTSAHQRLREAEKAVLRAESLTQQLLTFSRGGAPVREVVSVGEIVRDSVIFCLSGSNARHELDVPDDLWAARVDPGQIGQVIQNLVINADQAMAAGGTVRVSCRNERIPPASSPAGQPSPHVRVSVADEGIGIPPELRDRIFDPYFSTKQHGSGLGLATAYSIIHRHDGRIEVESELGRGTTFHVLLPAVEASTRGVADEHAVLGVHNGRILVMDDEEMIRSAAGDLLEHLGYEVETAPDGALAVKAYREALEAGHPFHAVIMDLTVPGGMGGKEAVRELLRVDPAAKAVASSGYSTDPVMADHRAHGFSAVVPKPYKMETLATTLDLLIRDGSR